MQFEEIFVKNTWIKVYPSIIIDKIYNNKKYKTLQINHNYDLTQRTKVKYTCECGKKIERNSKFNYDLLCSICKSKKTNLEKYGIDHNSKLKLKWDKVKITCQKKYGLDSPNSVFEIKEKKKQSYIAHFGFDHPLKNKDILQKVRKTTKKRYGYESILSDKEKIQKALKINLV